MEYRILTRWGAYGCATLLAMLASGCALTATLQVTPTAGVLGQSLSYKITITNPAACTLTGAEIILVPLVHRDAEVDQFCSALQNPLLILCEEVNPGDLPPDVLTECCADPTFAMQNPEDCSGATFGNPPANLRQDVESVLSSHPVTTTGIVAASDNSGAAVTCGFNGEFFDCLLDDIPAGQSETLTLLVTPTVNGGFANFVIAGGTLSCLGSGQIPFGGTCADTIVGGAPAPTLSGWGIVGAVMLLLAVGGWRMRSLYRPGSRRA